MEGNCQNNDVVCKCDVKRPLRKKKCIMNLQRDNDRAVFITIFYNLNFT